MFPNIVTRYNLELINNNSYLIAEMSAINTWILSKQPVNKSLITMGLYVPTKHTDCHNKYYDESIIAIPTHQCNKTCEHEIYDTLTIGGPAIVNQDMDIIM